VFAKVTHKYISEHTQVEHLPLLRSNGKLTVPGQSDKRASLPAQILIVMTAVKKIMPLPPVFSEILSKLNEIGQ
jgi:hypothetical protein